MRNRIRLSAIAAWIGLAVLSTWGGKVEAQSRWDLPELKRAGEETMRWNCRTAWDLIWPLAKAGNPEARHSLFTAIIFNTNPPGIDRQSAKELKIQHMLTLAVYGALSQVPPNNRDPARDWMRREIPILINGLTLGPKGEQVAQCYKTGGVFRHCLDLAVSLGVVPTFEDYAEQVETAERETGKAASCSYPH